MVLKGMGPLSNRDRPEFQLNLGTSLENHRRRVGSWRLQSPQMAAGSHPTVEPRLSEVSHRKRRCRTLQVHLSDCECLHENFLRPAVRDMRTSTDARILAEAHRDPLTGKSISRPL